MRLIVTKLPGRMGRLEIVGDDRGRVAIDRRKQRIVPQDMGRFLVEESMRGGFRDRTAHGAPAGFTVEAVAAAGGSLAGVHGR
ncbi:MAG: hypothetical protein RQ833_09550 [Sphingomonadaceae bacterium]|nr:hypothetical protein [Sphingomonadaceae bacterium]